MGGNPQRHIRSGPIAHPWAYCCQHDSHSHASLCFPQRRPEARVASALNELGRIAQQQGKLDDAEADFHRMADIYRSVYAGKHYYIGIAESNLAEVYVEKKNYKEGERLFSRSPQYVCPNPSVRPPASGNRAGQARARDSPAAPLFSGRKRNPRRI